MKRDGHITRDRITRHPQVRACRDCGRTAIAVIDLIGFEVWLDPTPLTPLEEFTALTIGIDTYRQDFYGATIYRLAHDIKLNPANKNEVHAKHRCDTRWTPKPKPSKTITPDFNQSPPF